MRQITLALALLTLAGPLAAQTSPQVTNDLTIDMAPQQYRICNERPARPTWMDEIHPRDSYKALTLMHLYELRAWEDIKATGDCGCEVRFPDWDAAEGEYLEQFSALTQAEHTQLRHVLREDQNQIAHTVRETCEAQGNW
jgi:hypothetical protein